MRHFLWFKQSLAAMLAVGASALNMAVVQAEDMGLDELAMEPDVPQVLTVTRLKQPKAETPASVTVIDAKQIEAWGARTVPEVLRFVPGMFVGASQKENTSTVVYHASTQNTMRRLQVLVDGRAIYKSAIARVIWDDLSLAVEDIDRIEVIRGPNSAAYGANAFLATINIITKNPDDTLGTRVRYRAGSQSIADAFVSHSGLVAQGSYRLSLSSSRDDGFDGPNVQQSGDHWLDNHDNNFANFALQQALSAKTQLRLNAGYTSSYADITNNSKAPEQQYRDTQSGFVQSRFNFDFSTRHQSQLQLYWQKEWREHERTFFTPVVSLDPNLAKLYQLSPRDTMRWLGMLMNPHTPSSDISAYVGGLSNEQQTLIGQILSGNDFSKVVQGTFDFGYTDERFDVEWQDTWIWSDNVRSVSGLSLRRDEAYSKTFFNGDRYNNTYRAFANIEWQPAPSWLLNAGATYEYDDLNQAAFSPRLAANYLFSPHQSVRLVYSEAVRAPDMLEQEPHMQAEMTNLGPNYLRLTQATYFQTQIYAHRGLEHERIRSYELGYYHALNRDQVELDVKLYREELDHLVSGEPSNIDENTVASDSSMTIQGIESQLKVNLYHQGWLWFTAAHMKLDAHIRKTRPYCTETCLSPENSFTTSWFHQGQHWSSTVSYLWLDGYRDNQHLYHRTEVQLKKEWVMGRFTPWIGGFWQYQLSDDPLGYTTQRYSTKHIFYVQAGLNF